MKRQCPRQLSGLQLSRQPLVPSKLPQTVDPLSPDITRAHRDQQGSRPWHAISMCDVFPTEFAGPAACPRSGQPRCPGWCPCGNIIRGIAPCTTMLTSRRAGPIRDISGEDPTRHSTGFRIWRKALSQHKARHDSHGQPSFFQSPTANSTSTSVEQRKDEMPPRTPNRRVIDGAGRVVLCYPHRQYSMSIKQPWLEPLHT